MATGVECCAACACCTPIMAYLPVCLQNLMGGGGCGGGPNCTFVNTCQNIANYIRCCDRCVCFGSSNTNIGEGATYSATGDAIYAASSAEGAPVDASKTNATMNKAITDIQGAQGIATAAANSGGMVVSPSLEARVTVMQPNSQAESSQTTSV